MTAIDPGRLWKIDDQVSYAVPVGAGGGGVKGVVRTGLIGGSPCLSTSSSAKVREKGFDVTLTITERAKANVKCPSCGGEKVNPQLTVFTPKTSRKS